MCGINEVMVNGVCNCNNVTVRTSDGSCQPCPPGQYAKQVICEMCLANCLRCENAEQCITCHSNYTGNSCEKCANGYFLLSGISPPSCYKSQCGDGIIQTGEQCDDNNLASGDGCSVNCKI